MNIRVNIKQSNKKIFKGKKREKKKKEVHCANPSVCAVIGEE
jgi:hypothetical protein